MSELNMNEMEMEVKELTLSDLEKVTGGKLESFVTDYLDEVIRRAKKADVSLERCVRDLYQRNEEFDKERENYVRARWNQIV